MRKPPDANSKVNRMLLKPFRNEGGAARKENYAAIPRMPRPCCRGFSLIEVLVAVGIVLVLAGMTAPKVFRMVEAERLQDTARAYASFLQQCRYQSEHDGQWYEILFDTANPNSIIAYLDIPGSGVRTANDPQVEIPYPITVPDPANANPALPAGFGNANLLGATPLTVDTTPATWNCQHTNCPAGGVQIAGLQFNERGLPCQRTSNAAACTNTDQINSGGGLVSAPVAWVTYLAYPTSAGGTNYAAVTVTPAGRIKVWNFQSDGAGGGTWN